MTARNVHRTQPYKRVRPAQRRSLLLCAAWALTTVPAITPLAHAQEARQHFDIAAGSLDQALQRYMALTGRQILYRSQLVEGRRTSAVVGSMDADKALRKLIGGYPIIVSHQGRNVYVLSPRAAPSPQGQGQSQHRPSPHRPPQMMAPRPKPVRAPDSGHSPRSARNAFRTTRQTAQRELVRACSIWFEK